MNYIQNKLDELIETYRKENYSEYDVRMVAERLATDYHNHIVEKSKEIFGDIMDNETEDALDEFVKYLQDTNQKE